ncbi:unnamed protein product, partial [Closterium sp. NIES-64]
MDRRQQGPPSGGEGGEVPCHAGGEAVSAHRAPLRALDSTIPPSPKQEVLLRLAATPARALPLEARAERCRAMRELRPCGRTVHHCLLPCRHACLCGECAQRCSACPVCRCPIGVPASAAAASPAAASAAGVAAGVAAGEEGSARQSGERIHIRLYDACVDAGLVSPLKDVVKDSGWGGGAAGGAAGGGGGGIGGLGADAQGCPMDVRRLFALFDIALDRGLVTLICHCEWGEGYGGPEQQGPGGGRSGVGGRDMVGRSSRGLGADAQGCPMDVRRLFALFDIALDRGLVTLICHCEWGEGYGGPEQQGPGGGRSGVSHG